MSHNSRLAYLLGEMRRMMNGAVVGSMRFYGADYGLNYGVSIPTIRSVAQLERGAESDIAVNHRFARLLLRQEVRELRLAAFWFADAQSITSIDDMREWSAIIINSEVAEEAAFALFYAVESVEAWLDEESNDELLHYCALLALAKRAEGDSNFALNRLWPIVIQLIDSEPHLLSKAVVALIDTAIKKGVATAEIELLLSQLPDDNLSSLYIRDEIAWRLDLR